ncbi:MAG TPA: hypothetical protein VER33_27845 [Polyangiaceae bacterium]|nr:hypothetical protein [Polyangiaceae bacterium]
MPNVRITSRCLVLLASAPACSLLAPDEADFYGNANAGVGGSVVTEGGSAGMRGQEPRGGSPSASGASSSGGRGATAAAGADGSAVGGLAGSGGTFGEGGTDGGGEAGSGGGEGGSMPGGGLGGSANGGVGGSVAHCAKAPCVRGTCSELANGFKCTCPAGWGGALCNVASCDNLSCPAAAPCRVPARGTAALCYPTACGAGAGLCMAANADGSGAAILLAGRNADFNPLGGANWRNRARYFAYLENLHGAYSCVFPQLSEQGVPLVIPVGEARTKTTGFGQSNSWPNPPTCAPQ